MYLESKYKMLMTFLFPPGTLHLHIKLKNTLQKEKKVQVYKYIFRNLVVAQTGFSLSVQHDNG